MGVLLPLPLGEVDLRSKDGEGKGACGVAETKENDKIFVFSDTP